jgi:hypothetical protein
VENRPRKLVVFLNEAGPDRERVRVLAQAIASAALSGKAKEDAEKVIGTTAAEKATIGKLLANRRSLIENPLESKEEFGDRRRGQKRPFERGSDRLCHERKPNRSRRGPRCQTVRCPKC